MAVGFVTALRSNRATAFRDAIDAGPAAGKLRIYDGTRPATGGTATNLLAELTFSDPCGTVTNGVLTFSAITGDTSADATGTATWARVLDSTNAIVADCSVTATGGGGDITFATTSFVAGVQVNMTSLTWTEANA